jgi:hypothetical protein
VSFAARLQVPFPGRLPKRADVAQLVEQLIRNQQVVSSSLTVGSKYKRMNAEAGSTWLIRINDIPKLNPLSGYSV